MSSKRSAPNAGPSKRARFAEPSENVDGGIAVDHLEDDLVVSSAAKTRARRSLKGEEGYKSDSSDDEDAPKRRGSKPAEDEMDEDEDIFGAAEKEDPAQGSSAGKKPKEDEAFIGLDDIEGQEFGGAARLRDAGADSDDLDSEDEAERLERAKGLDGPMGYEMTSFNMKDELTEGRLTAGGDTFIANDRDPGEAHDVWLDGMDRAAVRAAKRGKRERERLEQEREKKEDQEAGEERREEKLMGEMVDLLERGETVLEGLQRLGKQLEADRKKMDAAQGNKKKTWAEKQRERKAMLAGGGDGGMQVDESHPPSAIQFNRFSQIVSALQSLGHLDVYSMTRESLQRMIPAEVAGGPAVTPAASSNSNGNAASTTAPRAFEYRFSKPYLAALPEGQRPIERETFGPFPLPSLMEWRQSGALGGPECLNIELRSAGPTPGPWGSWREVVEGKQ